MAPKTHGLLWALALPLSALCMVSPAEAGPKKADLLRTWVVEGSDDRGNYGGFLEIKNAPHTRVELEAELTYTDGSVRTWKSTGHYVFGHVYARYTTASSGMTGHLNGVSGGVEVRCRLTPNEEGTELVGRHRSDAFNADDVSHWIGHGYRWSANVLADVLADHGLERDDLLLEAMSHDNGNRYLTRRELEDAADALLDDGNSTPLPPPPPPGPPGSGELRILSDIDKTLLPPGEPYKAPYPGVVTLYAELGNKVSYVTARTPDRIHDIPAWFATHGLPDGTIDTGINTLPWVAQPEKVKDVESVFATYPGARFVLFGDTSHKDPEVYKEILAKHPSRVAAVVMHKVNNVNPNRVVGMHLVENYAQAAAKLHADGLLDEAAARRIMKAAQAEGLAITDAEIDALLN